MVKHSRFRYKESIDKGFGIFQWNDADCILNVGYNTKDKEKKDTVNKNAEKKQLNWQNKIHFKYHWIYDLTLLNKHVSTTKRL